MCKIINSVFLIFISAIICFTEMVLFVSAYDTPCDLHLIIETKEIDINNIPENKVVSIDIYTENCPPYVMLSFLLEKDKRLQYMPYEYISDAEQTTCPMTKR